VCECERDRCCHVNGVGRCKVEYPPEKDWPEGSMCACQKFIRDDDNDGGEDQPEPVDPEVVELNRLSKL